ncbi:hypothetical protein C8Q76DRAFT_322288 [Earliella scabrosa]|nr:hypothetical protein C8Q76DRAFT_322288 [Earliella scabrosa]
MYSHRAGKTVFLLYLLLYRLERRLPTAIHLWSNHLVVFNDEGARTIRTVDDLIPMTSDYWALSDSNQIIKEPCPAFRRSTARLIQASSPRPDRCKDWLKYCKARIVVTDLPSTFEIGAIAKELQMNVAETFGYISKWGPCTRKILDLMSAATDICAQPAAYAKPETSLTPSTGESIFIKPHRPLAPGTQSVANSAKSFYHIPTPHLSEIFHSARQSMDNEKALQLFNMLASHALTRDGPAWNLEKRMHAYLCSNSQPLTIFNAQQTLKMAPSQRLLAGTAGALARCSEFPTFYWLPSSSNFPGIDGVLSDRDNVYAVQATIADEHRSPVKGLQKVWEASTTRFGTSAFGTSSSSQTLRRWPLGLRCSMRRS